MGTAPLEDSLLQLAEHLAADDGVAGEAALRRAVSTAYYGLFHAICRLCADELVGHHGFWETYAPIYRTPDHGQLKNFFEQCRESKTKQKPTHLGSDVAKIAQIFVDLQQARHTADYDPEPFVSRANVVEEVARARQAVGILRGLDPDIRLILAVSLVAKSRK